MGLSVADIDRWDAGALSAVSEGSTSRANAATAASGSLGRLPAFESWSGGGSAAAQKQTGARADDLNAHVRDSTAVANAARTASNEVRQVKTQLAELRSSAGSFGIIIDPASSRAKPPANFESLPTSNKRLVQTMIQNTQATIDKLLKAADKADDLLTNALKQADDKKVKLVDKSTEFDKSKKKQKDFGSKKDDGKDGKGGDDKSKKGNPVKIWGKEANSGKAEVYSKKAEGERTFDNGAKVEGSAGVEALTAEAGANVELTSDGLSAGANANATLVEGSIEGSAEYGIASVHGEAGAALEATADAQASIGKDGLNAGLEAFAGGRLTGDLGGEVGGVGVGAHGELQAGIGVSGDVNAGFEDGKFKVGGSVGAALGVGGKVGFDIEIDPTEVTDTIKDAAGNVADFFGF